MWFLYMSVQKLMGNIEDIPVHFESFYEFWLPKVISWINTVLPIVDCSVERIVELFIKMCIFN